MYNIIRWLVLTEEKLVNFPNSANLKCFEKVSYGQLSTITESVNIKLWEVNIQQKTAQWSQHFRYTLTWNALTYSALLIKLESLRKYLSVNSPIIIKPVTWFTFQTLFAIQIMFVIWNLTNKSITNFLSIPPFKNDAPYKLIPPIFKKNFPSSPY